MKYEPIFGDQSLFDGAPEDADAVFKSPMRDSRCAYYRLSHGHERYIYTDWVGVPAVDSQTFNAMRLIIQEPKRWTWEDQKAGRFPEVGCKVATVNGECVIIGVDLNPKFFAVQYQYPDDVSMDILHISKIKPIETTEEKERRARKEWCIKALSSCSILSGMQKYELKRLGGYIEDIYDALLSGELPMPAAPEQNK